MYGSETSAQRSRGCDDGIGVKNPERVLNSGAGVGLVGMRERMTKLGGSLELRSTGGTTIVATVPIERLS